MPDGATATAEAGPAAPERVNPEQSAKLGRLGRGLMDGEAQRRDVLAKPLGSLSGAENKLQVIQILQQGKMPDSDEPLKDVNLTGGKLLTMQKEFSVPKSDGTNVDGLCVAGISEVNADGSYKVYFAKVNGDGKAGDIVYDTNGDLITGDMGKEYLVDLQATAEAEDLATLFKDENKTAFTAYTDSRREGDSYVPPDKLDDIIEKVAEDEGITFDVPKQEVKRGEITDVDRFIAGQITTLQNDLAAELKAPPGKETDQKITRINGHLRDLKLAALEKGAGGAFYRIDALGNLRTYLDDKSLEATAGGNTGAVAAYEGQMTELDKHVGEMSTQVEAPGGAKDELKGMIENSELPDATKDAYLQQIDNNQAASVLANENVMKLGGISQFVFGRENFDRAQLEGILNDNQIPESVRNNLSDILKKGSLNGAGLLAILLGLPLAAALAITQGIAMMAKNR